MGGWCRQREACAHYHSKSKEPPADRLCGPIEEPEKLKDEKNRRMAQEASGSGTG
jgi:hypothetical protein